jgi:hypothetical protein
VWYTSHYVVDWDKVQTSEDIKRLLIVFGPMFEPDTKGLETIMDLVVLKDKEPISLSLGKA